jgi:hypothetical protein
LWETTISLITLSLFLYLSPRIIPKRKRENELGYTFSLSHTSLSLYQGSFIIPKRKLLNYRVDSF